MLEFSLVSYMMLGNVVNYISLIIALIARMIFITVVFGIVRLVLMLMLTLIFA